MDLNSINQLNTEISQQYDLPINCIIMNRSDHYPAAYFRSSLFILGITYLVFYYIPFDVQDPIWMIGLSIPAVFLGQILAFFPRYKRFFISSGEMKEECYQQALEQGYEMGVLNEANSLFIYLSLFERRIEVFSPDDLKGKKIKEEIKPHFKKLVKSLKKNHYEEGLKEFYNQILLPKSSTVTIEDKVEIEKLDTPPVQSAPYNVD